MHSLLPRIQGMGLKVDYCPRCGMSGYLEVHCTKHNNAEYCYYRIVHYYKDGGKRKKKTCYLGPVNREYLYVERIHRLGLTSILHQDTAVVVHNAITSYIDRVRDRARRGSDIKRLIREVEKLRGLLNKLASDLALLQAELEKAGSQ
jgi:hypothetical protein